MKNKITLFVDGEKIELYNFSKLDHYLDRDHRSYVRILCDTKYYYFLTSHTAITEIEVYEKENQRINTRRH